MQQKIPWLFSRPQKWEGKGWWPIETGILCVVLAGAAWTDIREGKVRNRWLFAGMAAGVWCRGRDFFPPAGMVLVIAFCLYRMGMMGAGDGKLMAVIAGYLGMDAGMKAIFIGMAAGVLWSLCRSWHDKVLKTRLIYLSAYLLRWIQTGKKENYCDLAAEKGNHIFPLAAALAAGTYFYLLVSRFAVMGG